MKILHFHEIRVSKGPPNGVSDSEHALLCTLAFALNEITSVELLLVQSIHSNPKNDLVAKAKIIQQNTLLRILSAKIFEAVRLFESFRRQIDRAPQERLSQHLTGILHEVDQHKCTRAWRLAQHFRDKTTNHYLPTEVRTNLEFVSARSDRTIVLHENHGNCFYPIGEEAVFIASLVRWLRDNNEDIGPMDALREWREWSSELSGWLSRKFDDYLGWYFEHTGQERAARHLTPYVEPELYPDFDSDPLPVFLNLSQWSDRKNDT